MRPPTGTAQPPATGIAAKKAWPRHLVVTLTLVAAAATMFNPIGTTSSLDTLLLLLAAIASILAPARSLPLQSVVFAAFITALVGGTAHGFSAWTGLPFGPLTFGPTSGPQLFNTVPWTVPLVWVIAVFNSRGVARLVLRPWRKVKNYGFLLIGLTAAQALIFDLALEPFARAKHLWLWQPTKIPFTWYGASPLAFCGWTFVVLLILAVIMPFLIRKQPGKPSAPDFMPLALWLGAVALFAVNAAQAGFWPAVVVDVIVAAAAAFFSWQGSKW